MHGVSTRKGDVVKLVWQILLIRSHSKSSYETIIFFVILLMDFGKYLKAANFYPSQLFGHKYGKIFYASMPLIYWIDVDVRIQT